MIRLTKVQRRERWMAECAAYSTAVLTWQVTVAKDLPASVRLTDRAGRAMVFAAEATRSHLESRRQRLLLEASRLGIAPDLPEAAWPEGKKSPEASLYAVRESA